MILQRQHFAARRIVIDPFQDDVTELVSYDLHVGGKYRRPGIPTDYQFPAAKPLVLKPNTCIVVWTKEKFSIPDDVFGMLCSKGSLTASGLMVANTKVDPMFHGQLRIAVYNASNRPIHMRHDMAFCSIVFQTLEQKTLSATHRDPPDTAGETRGPLGRAWDSVSGAPLAVALVTIIGAFMVAVAGTYVTIKFTSPPPASSRAQPATPSSGAE